MPFPFLSVDLTHPLSSTTPSWSGSCGFKHEIKLDYDDRPEGVPFRIQKIIMHAGIGTHMDAPSHCVPGGKNIADIPLHDLVVPCVVIDISDHAHERYQVSPHDILVFEKCHGRIPKGCCVMIRTGWEKFWHQPEKYRNNWVFPSVSQDAALLLLERNIVGLGIDTLSPDCGDSGYPVHDNLLGAGRYIIENVAHIKSMPPIGGYSLALPINIVDGTEAPIRLIGLVNIPHQGSFQGVE